MVERPIKKSERQNVVGNSDAVESTVEVSSSTGGSSNSEGFSEGRKIAAPRRKEKGEKTEGSGRGERGERRERGERGERGKGKGKGDRQDDRKPASLALMRGPRPSQAKPPVLAEPSEEATTEPELEQVETLESEEAVSPEA